ncbi:MAG: IS3 family transposase [Nocardioidaceae bacterium]
MLCRLLKVSTSGYYAWASRPPSAREVADGVLTAQIQAAFDDNRKVYGAPRIHAELADADVHVGRKRIARLMREAGIVGCHRRKHKVGTTKQNPNATVAPPDLVDRKFTATAPNQLWVADVTYVPDGPGLALPGLCHRRVLPDDPGLVDGQRTARPTWSSTRSPWRCTDAADTSPA